jgi:hypothetical protein
MPKLYVNIRVGTDDIRRLTYFPRLRFSQYQRGHEPILRAGKWVLEYILGIPNT